MNVSLNKFVKQFGKDAIYDIKRLSSYLLSEKADEKYVLQISLVIGSGNLKDNLSKDESQVSNVVLNNILINTVTRTGLKQTIVQKILCDIFTALDIQINYESFWGYDTETGAAAHIEKMISPEKMQSMLKEADDLLDRNDPEYKVIAIKILGELATQGSPEAMYRLGVIKKDELSNELNTIYNKVLNFQEIENERNEIRQLFEKAASNGNAAAKAELGDYWYEKQRYDKAYKYYSSPGVITVNPNTKNNIVDIINKKQSNVLSIILGGITLLVIWIFLFVNYTSVHNEINLLGLGIPLTIICTVIYGLMCFSYFKYYFINTKFYIVGMVALWSIFPLVLAIN